MLTDSLDQSCSLSRGNGLLILFLGFLFLLHLPNIHLTFDFPVRHKDESDRMQLKETSLNFNFIIETKSAFKHNWEDDRVAGMKDKEQTDLKINQWSETVYYFVFIKILSF